MEVVNGGRLEARMEGSLKWKNGSLKWKPEMEARGGFLIG